MAAPLRLQLCCIAQFFIYCIASSAVQAQQQQQSAAHQNSSFMRLSHSPAFNFSPLAPVNMNVSNIAIRNIDYGYFFPILSSPSFKTWNSSADSPGFSLGFYFWYDSISHSEQLMYLAVCAGSFGSRIPDNNFTLSFNQMDGIESSSSVILYTGAISEDGFVVPVWFAPLDHPIKAYPDKVSLVLVTHDNTTNVGQSLQLKDGEGEVVWRCCSNGDAAQMELSNSGDFLIYNSAGAPVFSAMQGQRLTDTLVQGQRLSVGMQLTSNDSAYSARVEKGGLALYLNSMRHGAAPAAPYWVFPFFRNPDPINSPAHRPITLNQLLHSSPPNDSCIRSDQLYIPPYISVPQGFFNSGAASLLISSGSNCSSTLVHELSIENYGIVSQSMFGFLRLENDGKLYLYTLYTVNNDSPYNYLSYYRFALDSEDLSKNVTGLMADVIGRQQCDVPLGCGPLGLCTAYEGLQSMCSCPDPPSFQPVNKTDFTKGCKRQKAFDLCSATTFAELESTANIFLLTGWTFFTDKNLQACKHVCSLDCSCQGISYQNSTSNCFLMTQNISLLAITQDSNELAWNYTATSEDTIYTNAIVRKNDFVTHLKVSSPVSTPTPFVSNYTPTRFPLISTLIGIIPFGIVMCFLLGLGLSHFRKRRSRLLQQAKEEEELRDILPLLPTRFSFKELQEATKRFSKLLGSGACGSVYEGTLLDGRKVAVKVLEGVLQRAHQAKEFLAEIATVGRTGHHNIVRLVGFCWQGSHHILVYEFMVKGSLDRWLFGPVGDGSCASDLNWQKRYNVALGVARGLDYLHEDCEQPILHCDIKPQNILLSEQFVAKISDFGMSRLMQRDMHSCVMTGVRGTPGYIAPEWFLHGSVSKKSDIYSLGIVMLEIVAGRKVLEFSRLNTTTTVALSVDGSSTEEAWHLPSWAEKKWEQGCLMDIVDPLLHEELVTYSNVSASGFDEVEAQRLLYIALWCIQEDPALRSHAATVVKWLEGCEPNVPQPPHASNSTKQTTLRHSETWRVSYHTSNYL